MLSFSMILVPVCIVCVTLAVLIDATEDVFIRLKYGNTTSVYNNVSFSEELFGELHTCMCEGHSVCYATYNIQPDPFRITEITPNDGNQTEAPVYRCGHPEYSDKEYNGILCINTGLPENSYQTSQITSFLYLKSVSDCSQTCVRIEWVHPDEGMFFPSDLQPSIHYCDVNCNCSITTSPLAMFSTSSTLSPLISSRPSSAETTSVPTSKTTANWPLKSSKTSSTEIAAASTSKTTTNSPLMSSRPSSAETAPVSTSKTTANLPSAQGLPADSHSTSAGSEKPTSPTTSKTNTNSSSPQVIPADSHSTSAEPTASSGQNNDVDDGDDNDDDVPVGILTGAAAGVVAVIIIIVVLVFWKRRKRESKLPDHPSHDNKTYYSSPRSSKQQNAKHQSTELSYVNVTPPGVSDPYISNYGRNIRTNYSSIQRQEDNENYGDDFGYSTAHDATSGMDYATSSWKTPPNNKTKPKDGYAVVNNDMSMTDNANSSAYTTSEANNVYSRLHENAAHMSNPYDSLLQLKMQPGSGNHLREPTHSLNPAFPTESSPYSLARPISEAPNHKLSQHRL